MRKNKIDWIAIEGSFRSGLRSIREIAKEHDITDAAIRAKAKREGWVRDPQGTKRERVKAAMSGVGSQEGSQFALRTIEEAVQQDIADMDAGLSVARACIKRLQIIIETVDDPRDVRTIAEANKIAIETIRRIRGLDSETASSPSITAVTRIEIVGIAAKTEPETIQAHVATTQAIDASRALEIEQVGQPCVGD